MPDSNSYILGSVGPTGGPTRCVGTFGLPDSCSTKGATCCHTPPQSIGFPISSVSPSGSTASTPWWNGPSRQTILVNGYENYYVVKHPNAGEPSGCRQPPVSSTGYKANLISFKTPDGDFKQFPGTPENYRFFVNYGCSIQLEIFIYVPLLQYSINCDNWGYLSIRGLNAPNLGTLTGDWYKNSPYGTYSGFFCNPYNCDTNTSLSAGPIIEPYRGVTGSGISTCERGGTAFYYADLNPYASRETMRSFVCSESNYCCPNWYYCEDPEPSGMTCSPSGTGACTLYSGGPGCICGYAGNGFDVCPALQHYSPYAYSSSTYEYTCDNLTGVEINFVLDSLYDISNYTGMRANENGDYSATGPYLGTANRDPGSWAAIRVSCVSCGNCVQQSYCS